MSVSEGEQPSTNRQQRIVLSEDDYQQNLSKIIQRDFYPEVAVLEQQLALQEARESGNLARAVEIRRASRQQLNTEIQARENEWMDEQFALVENSGTRCRPRPLDQESLTGFHARATSEDNAEFHHVQKKEMEKRRLLLTNFTTSSPPRNKRRAPDSPLMASDEFRSSPYRSNFQPVDAENSLFFVPNALKNNLQNDKETALMPPPAAKTNAKHELVEYAAKAITEKKRIEPSATRFPGPKHNNLTLLRNREIELHHQQQQHLEGDDADSVAASSGYFSTSNETEASTDLDSPALPLYIEREQGRLRKQRELETLVQMTPQVPPKCDSQDILTNQEGDCSLYRIPEESARERAARKAQSNLDSRLSKKRKLSRRTNSSSVSLSMSQKSKLQKLTPAAQSLWKCTTSTARPESVRSGSAFATALRSSYNRSAASTSSSKRPGSSSQRRRDPGEKDNLCISSDSNRRPIFKSEGSSTITSGLLKLPK